MPKKDDNATPLRKFLLLNKLNETSEEIFYDICLALNAQVFLRPMPNAVDALTLCTKECSSISKYYLIIINQSHNEKKIRHSLACQLGHIVMNHDLTINSSRQDKEASQFADELLFISGAKKRVRNNVEAIRSYRHSRYPQSEQFLSSKAIWT